jgi:hypothetical protein
MAFQRPAHGRSSVPRIWWLAAERSVTAASADVRRERRAGRTIVHLTGLADMPWHPASASPGARLARFLSRGEQAERLAGLLSGGALLVASHDVPFLRSAGITRWLRLDRVGPDRQAGLTEVDPL